MRMKTKSEKTCWTMSQTAMSNLQTMVIIPRTNTKAKLLLNQTSYIVRNIKIIDTEIDEINEKH
jgi:phosphatidate phosphatase PAH1